MQFVVLGAFLLLYLILFFTYGINIPRKLPTMDYPIVIDDKSGVIQESEDLLNELAIFQDKTGITPVIHTVYERDFNEVIKEKSQDIYKSLEWLDNTNGRNLSKYAYEYYIENYSDETHWVIVYSIPRNGIDWEFEGMQGNDTDGILTERFCEKFNDMLSEELDNGNSLSTSLTNTFRKYNKEVMKVSLFGKSSDDLLIEIVESSRLLAYAVILLPIYSIVSLGEIIRWLYVSHSKQVDQTTSTASTDSSFITQAGSVCRFCGYRLAVSGVSCPNCGKSNANGTS